VQGFWKKYDPSGVEIFFKIHFNLAAYAGLQVTLLNKFEVNKFRSPVRGDTN